VKYVQKTKTDITKTKHNPEKANNTKYSRTKLAWFSRLMYSTMLPKPTRCQKFSFRCVSDKTFGERPRKAAGAHLLLLAGSQHRCSVDCAEALKV